MDTMRLWESLAGIDEALLERSENAVGKKRSGKPWGYVLAASLGAAAILLCCWSMRNAGRAPTVTVPTTGYRLVVYREGDESSPSVTLEEGEESYWFNGDEALAHLPSPEEPEGMSREEAERYAYMKLEDATEELAEKIREARAYLIRSSSWVTDGYVGFVVDTESGERKQLPSFSQLFPDWEMPEELSRTQKETENGLGAELLYRARMEVLRVEEGGLWCRVMQEVNYLKAGEELWVAYPESVGSESVQFRQSDTVIVTYYGKDYRPGEEIRAAGLILTVEETQ